MQDPYFNLRNQIIALSCLLLIFNSCKKDSETNPDLATVSTDRIEAITKKSAKVVSTVSKEGKSVVTGMGIVWGKKPNPTFVSDNKIAYSSFGIGTFSIDLVDLEPGTYYVRTYATNASGTAYSDQKSFSTIPLETPALTTAPASNVSYSSVTLGAEISSIGIGPVSKRGICWSTNENPTEFNDSKIIYGTATNNYTFQIKDLKSNTKYFARAFATNSDGTGYGNQISFITPSYFMAGNGVSDLDGNSYSTVKIGNQEWMKENLKVSRYRNGNPIPNNLSNNQWVSTTDGAYSVYYNNPNNNDLYGKLYNWFTITDPRGLCPVGWHVPTKEEWTTLENLLDGPGRAGGKLKSLGRIEDGSGLWYSNSEATNESGFTGLPGGLRLDNGGFSGQGVFGNWWSSSSSTNMPGSAVKIYIESPTGFSRIGGENFRFGLSVRCIKD